ncbi:hypothetical protein CDAR_200751 [Caerostris darwini]|uniref:Uncharacterized protein n=1 Tax=Caerostris darwini TaxID=1538125 RepID=A0AAV4PTZ6_9ARAC|nr:hypothetical protein CDAR_200751 [Caerostris darwini]
MVPNEQSLRIAPHVNRRRGVNYCLLQLPEFPHNSRTSTNNHCFTLPVVIIVCQSKEEGICSNIPNNRRGWGWNSIATKDAKKHPNGMPLITLLPVQRIWVIRRFFSP